MFISNESTLHCRAVQYLLKNSTEWIFTLALLWSAGSDMYASLIVFSTPGNFLFGSANLYHLNFDQVKLNRSFIDCMLGRKSTNGTFASFSANSFQNRCYCNLKTQRRKIIETMISFDNAVHFRTKTEEVMTLQWCAQKISLWITDSSLVTIFVFIRLLRE